MLEKISALIAAQAFLRENLPELHGWLKDTSVPLEDRWQGYTSLVESRLLDNESGCGDGYINVLGPNLTLYDDFNIDRHQSTTFPEMYETITDADDEFGGDGYDAANIPKWQETVLASGYSGFTYDW
jgi:hypothetical protein